MNLRPPDRPHVEYDDLERINEIIELQGMLAREDADAQAVMQAVVDRAPALMHAQSATIEMAEGDHMVCRTASRTLASHVGFRLSRGNCLPGLAVITGQVLLCGDTESDSRVDLEACRKLGMRALACAPLQCAGTQTGALRIGTDQPRGFDSADVQALRLLAGIVSAALTRDATVASAQTGAGAGGTEQEQPLAAARNTLRVNEARMRNVMANALDATVLMDDGGNVIGWNRQAEVLFGWTAAEATGRPVSNLILAPRYRERYDAGLNTFLETGIGPGMDERLELPAIRRNGEEFPAEISMNPVRLGERWEFVAFVRDISARQELEHALQEQASRDPLTGLGNRASFLEALCDASERAKEGMPGSALLILDLDDFKSINERYGHHAGDGALREFARRLKRYVRRSDVVARLGGDEFTVLAEGATVEAQVRSMCAKLLAKLAEPWQWHEHSLTMSARIGVATVDGCHADSLAYLGEAERAMRRAKQRPSHPVDMFRRGDEAVG